MSWQPASDPWANAGHCPSLQTVIIPRARDLGGFEVRRALPSAQRQMIGPFIFWDQMGPATFAIGGGIDVRPHPHIGLATLTYLFDGEIMHRDSLGSVQPIRPGDVNLMIAGSGITHSERTDPARRLAPAKMFGIQSWIALPKPLEEMDPAFIHIGSHDLPVIDGDGVRLRLIAGDMHGARSPLKLPSPTIYADAAMATGSRIDFPADHEERAVYIAEGSIQVAMDRFDSGQLLIFAPGDAIVITALTDARVLLLGGEPMDGPRHVWWNFVSSSRDRIDQAKADWKSGRFPQVPQESEFIPLPD